ncbi:MAG: hypothetical protein ABGX83_08980 [Nitrospira sp.]
MTIKKVLQILKNMVLILLPHKYFGWLSVLKKNLRTRQMHSDSKKRRSFTSRGEAFAELVPCVDPKKKDKAEAVQKMKAFMLENPVRGVNIKELIEQRRSRNGRVPTS